MKCERCNCEVHEVNERLCGWCECDVRNGLQPPLESRAHRLSSFKSAEEWVWEHTKICHNDPAVHGQLLPGPQMAAFLKDVQIDALKWAAGQIVTDGNPDVARDKILARIAALTGGYVENDVPLRHVGGDRFEKI